ncbi:hypothetical protein BKA70DRAFT_1249988 [Coprinopsis sp. MPI-PUGE-AT-0042]|nr:hypothetical protein BKA70DRAFT_1269668 [Coprinopsis sp. MPI-PUGE-AT-0042]KAH6916579.1 hypothetical protein BKA70DRAFT_1249988 [Coprinopsis sp. MPI-PUGE-AT-0042]
MRLDHGFEDWQLMFAGYYVCVISYDTYINLSKECQRWMLSLRTGTELTFILPACVVLAQLWLP